jgi:gentisate 1,2-dioxygenase
VVWMDGLDVPLVKALNAIFFELYDKEQVPLNKPNNASAHLHGHSSLSPTWVKERSQSSPLLLYSWQKTWQALEALRDTEGDAHDGIALEYTHPQTGRSLLPTMACWIQMLRPGRRYKAHRQTGTAVYYVAQGTGETIIDGCRFAWGKGDIIALPSWALHEHANLSPRDPAVLFSIQDRPVFEALGLYREEALADGGGHQLVTSTFTAQPWGA